jgi:uncharacterized protein
MSGKLYKMLRNLLITFCALYGVVLVVGLLIQRKMFYPAAHPGREPNCTGATLVRIPVRDGSEVYALYAPAPDGAPTLVHFHGNGEQLEHQTALVNLFRSRGLGVFAVEYPGYGLAHRLSATETSITTAAESALIHLRDVLGVKDIVLQGQSLGTGVAVEMARRGHGSRMVLLSPYTSMVDMVAAVVPVVGRAVIVLDRYDSWSKAPGIEMPVLIFHGSQDELIPMQMGQRLSQRFPNATFVRVPEAGHNDLLARGGVQMVSTIVAFARGEQRRGVALGTE